MKIKIKGNEKILIIQYRPIGDVLLTTPVAEYLKKKYPNIKIDFLVFDKFYPILKNNPFINEVLRMKKVSKKGLLNFIKYVMYKIKIIQRVRNENYDIILDYIGLPSSAIICYLSGAKYTVGYKHLRIRNIFYNMKAQHDKKTKYTVSRKYDLLKPLGINANEPVINTKLYLSDEEKLFADDFFKTNGIGGQFNVLFSPGSPKIFRRWSVENYRDLGKMLINKYGAKILIQYGPGEKEYCERLKKSIGMESILLPKTTIMQMAAIIKNVSLGIFNCGGVKHIGIAVGTPSITIFGKSNPDNWHPPSIKWAEFLKGNYVEGDSNFGICPDDVVKKIDVLIKNGIVKYPGVKKEFI